MAERVLHTDFKRIGRSGQTVDGREISPDMIDQMADSYNKELFTAMIWPDHQRWANYGTVEQLRAEDNDEGGRDLYAVLSPNQMYLGSNSYGQKLFSSMEITVDFRKTGKAYLTGLGATDDPASAATSEIRFSKMADVSGVLLAKITEAESKTFTETQPLGLLEQIKELIFKQTPEKEDDMDKATLTALQTSIVALSAQIAAMTPEPVTLESTEHESDATLSAKFDALSAQIDALVEKFNAVPEPKPVAEATPEPKPASEAEFAAIKAQVEKLSQQLAEALKEQPGTDGGEHFGGDADENAKYIV